MNVEAVLVALFSAALLSSMPLMLAGAGEAIGERAGLLNLGIEGTMLFGGFVGFWVALRVDSLVLGLLAGAMAGLLAGALFGILSVVVTSDQVVLGLGFTLVGGGITAFLFRESFGSDQPLLASTMARPLAGFGDALPIIGPAILDQKWFVFVSWSIVALCEIVLRYTSLGLRIRAVGESPGAVDATGISVVHIRLTAALVASTLTGLAGASLTIVELGFFQPNVTLGLGFIAIAVAMLGQLTPWRIAGFAILFGVLRGLGTGLQLANVSVRSEIVQLLPYLGIVIALIIVGRKVSLPSGLGQGYVRERSRSDV